MVKVSNCTYGTIIINKGSRLELQGSQVTARNDYV